MTRVLLLGASGLLGSHLCVRLPRSFDTMACTRTARPIDEGARQLEWLPVPVDATRLATVRHAVEQARPDVVVNAIGITPEAAETAGDRTVLDAVNGAFPHQLAAIAEDRGARVVHISSDGVFSGARGVYREDDDADPGDAYGRSKLAGELPAPHLTLRTSFFGRSRRGSGLIEWLIRQQGRAIEGFGDYLFTPVSASVLSDLIASAVVRTPALEGVYHVGGEATTKYDLLAAAVAQLRLDVRLTRVEHGHVDRRLDSSRFFEAVGDSCPVLSDMIATLGTCLASTPA
jgi:dTDP-4-dehydrorhamnose reductase